MTAELLEHRPQSTLDIAGNAADVIADLFYWMVAGGAVIWLAVVGLSLYGYRERSLLSPRAARRLVIVGGVIVPLVVLTGLLAYGLRLMPDLLARAPEGSLTVHVTGHQYWWRVRYLLSSGESIELANELHLPVGAPVELLLDSADVIHSFWIPALGGKMDMIPGHRTRLRLEPQRTGVFRGTCAEYCGEAHAWMSFPVVIHEAPEFQRWLALEGTPAAAAATPLAREGAQSFATHGCGACHSVRGTEARGTIGPDLTHVGRRISLGAGRLANELDAFTRWVAHPDRVKPSVHMPAFAMLPADELLRLSAYLEHLQ